MLGVLLVWTVAALVLSVAGVIGDWIDRRWRW